MNEMTCLKRNTSYLPFIKVPEEVIRQWWLGMSDGVCALNSENSKVCLRNPSSAFCLLTPPCLNHLRSSHQLQHFAKRPKLRFCGVVQLMMVHTNRATPLRFMMAAGYRAVVIG